MMNTWSLLCANNTPGMNIYYDNLIIIIINVVHHHSLPFTPQTLAEAKNPVIMPPKIPPIACTPNASIQTCNRQVLFMRNEETH